MKVAKDKVVGVSYQLEVEGIIADKSEAGHPLEYIHGTGMLIPGFEADLDGKEPGDLFDFVLFPEQGYGEYNPGYRVSLPKSSFMIEGKLVDELLQIGRILPMYNSEGQVVQGTVAEIGEENVIMDFNHPMAGKTLHFSGKVESVREATEKELAEGLHGEFLPPEEGCGHHCGGGCHHSEGGCCHGGTGEGEGCGCHHDGEGCHEDEGCCHGGGHCKES